MSSFDFHHLGAFFRPELSRFPLFSPSFEGAILDSKLENVGPTQSGGGGGGGGESEGKSLGTRLGPTLSSLLCAEAYAWNMTLLL